MDALALVGTEGDAGFLGAGTLFHLFLLVFLFHFNLEVTYKKKIQSVLVLPAKGKACCSYKLVCHTVISMKEEKAKAKSEEGV